MIIWFLLALYKAFRLLCSESNNGILLCGALCGSETWDVREKHAENNKEDRVACGKSRNSREVYERSERKINYRGNQIGNDYTDKSRKEADDLPIQIRYEQ